MGLFALFAGILTAEKVDKAISTPNDSLGQSLIKGATAITIGKTVTEILDDDNEVENLFDDPY